MLAAITVRSQLDRPELEERPIASPSVPRQELHYFGLDIAIGSDDQLAFHVDNDVESSAPCFVLVLSERLTKNTSASITIDGFTDTARRCESEANPIRITFENECGEISGMDLPSSLIHTTKR
jgi:hypothetical protein